MIITNRLKTITLFITKIKPYYNKNKLRIIEVVIISFSIVTVFKVFIDIYDKN